MWQKVKEKTMKVKRISRFIGIIALLVTFSGCANRAVVDRHPSFRLDNIEALINFATELYIVSQLLS